MSSYQNKVIPIGNDDSLTKTGRVISNINDDFEIIVSGKTVRAKKAFSCIINPLPDDTVICCKNENGIFYILGIIERDSSSQTNISFPSDTNIELKEGNLNILAKNSISLSSKDLNFFSKKTVHKSKEAIVCYDDVIATGKDFQASFKSMRLISNLINTMAKHVFESFRSYNRNTEDSDQIKAGQLTRKTNGSYLLDSKHTIMNSKECTKIDGEKILMG
jgi:hypothetical protein